MTADVLALVAEVERLRDGNDAFLADNVRLREKVERLRGLLREAKSLLFATQHPTMDGSEHRAITEFLARPLEL